MKSGRILLAISIISRIGVVTILCALAMLTHYHNLKKAYNNPRLVELSSGKTASWAYQQTDKLLSLFGEPEEVARKSGGMTWSIRLAGVPFTDPVAALSVLAKNKRWELGFALGLIVPLSLAFIFGRVFCSYICPASLLFFSISRIRKLLSPIFFFPDIKMNRGFSWGILAGGLIMAIGFGHGTWIFILPYFAVGQTLFAGIASGTLSVALGSLILFSALDLFLGKQFTCRYVCPTGRILGFIGRKSPITIQRDSSTCLDTCQSCIDACPMKVQPKYDETIDCSICGECLTVCPPQCLSIGLRQKLGTQ